MANPNTLPNPARSALAVDVSAADQALDPDSRGIYVGGAGDLKVDMADSTTAVTFSAVLAGSILPIQVSNVYNSGTTATLILALY